MAVRSKISSDGSLPGAGIMAAIPLLKTSHETPFSTKPLTPSTTTLRGIRHAPSRDTPLEVADAASATACLNEGPIVLSGYRKLGFGLNWPVGFSTIDFIWPMLRTNRFSTASSAPTEWSRWNVSLELVVAPAVAWPAELVDVAQPATRRMLARTLRVLVACSRAIHAA